MFRFAYRAEFRFDLKGTQPIIIRKLFNTTSLLIEVKASNSKPTWIQAGRLAQVLILPLGAIANPKYLQFGTKQILDMNVEYGAYYLQFDPKPWLGRTQISIWESVPDIPTETDIDEIDNLLIGIP